MYKETLQAIAGIEIFPVLSLLLFVVVFGTVLFWTSRLDRARLSEFAQLPLDEAAPAQQVSDAGAGTTVKGVPQ
jgi:cytochrome c oxidase cbb3-type subunit 4